MLMLANTDVLWSVNERETDDQQDARSRKALDHVRPAIQLDLDASKR